MGIVTKIILVIAVLLALFMMINSFSYDHPYTIPTDYEQEKTIIKTSNINYNNEMKIQNTSMYINRTVKIVSSIVLVLAVAGLFIEDGVAKKNNIQLEKNKLYIYLPVIIISLIFVFAVSIIRVM